jgi:hypothetical protein
MSAADDMRNVHCVRFSKNQAEQYPALLASMFAMASQLGDDLSQGGPSQHDVYARSLNNSLSQTGVLDKCASGMIGTLWTTGLVCGALFES